MLHGSILHTSYIFVLAWSTEYNNTHIHVHAHTCTDFPPDGDLIIDFEQLQYSVNEDGISIDVCVTISSTPGVGQTVSASYETVELTATGERLLASC